MFCPIVRFNAIEHLVAIEHRHVQVQEHQQRLGTFIPCVLAFTEQVVERLLAVASGDNIILDVCPTQVLLDQAGVAQIVFHQKNGNLSNMAIAVTFHKFTVVDRSGFDICLI
ncbi:MAG: hypothetical protein KKC18_16140 [Chloroflexi bacterium]|nr:hypothetical protein [Chloroflexota bacterium]